MLHTARQHFQLRTAHCESIRQSNTVLPRSAGYIVYYRSSFQKIIIQPNKFIMSFKTVILLLCSLGIRGHFPCCERCKPCNDLREFRKTAFSPQSQSERILELIFRRLRVGVVIPSTLILTLHCLKAGVQERRNDNTHPKPSKFLLEKSLILTLRRKSRFPKLAITQQLIPSHTISVLENPHHIDYQCRD